MKLRCILLHIVNSLYYKYLFNALDLILDKINIINYHYASNIKLSIHKFTYLGKIFIMVVCTC